MRLRSLVPVLVACLVAVGGCATVGGAPEPAEEAFPPEPPIVEGPVTPTAEVAAARLLARARATLRDGVYVAARDAAAEVVEEFPTAPSSSLALRYLAEAQIGMGEHAAALEPALRYAELFPEGDPRRDTGLVLAGIARTTAAARAEGDAEDEVFEGVTLLLGVGDSTARAWSRPLQEAVREAVTRVDLPALELLSAEARAGHPAAAPLQARLALELYRVGRVDEAKQVAGTLARAGVPPAEGEIARAILADEVEAYLGPLASVGLFLPEGAAEGLLSYAEEVREGVAVALEEFREGGGMRVELLEQPEGGPSAIMELQSRRVVGIVGPLLSGSLAEAAARRTTPVPLVSPTAPLTPAGAPGVYSVSGPDPGDAITLADYVVGAGYTRIALMYPRLPVSEIDAEAFRGRLTQLGRSLTAEVVYHPDTTYFQAEAARIRSAAPQALVLLLEPEDVEIVAPQLTFFGLDTLGIQFLGSAGWTDDAVLGSVSSRHLDGVIAAAPAAVGEATPAYRSFVAAYEALHRKGLTSDIPPLGYDAAKLLLTAARARPGNAQAAIAAIESIQGLQGTTGILSVEDGRIVRRHRLVRIQMGTLVPLGGGEGEPAPGGAR